jgi:hypothetical protein
MKSKQRFNDFVVLVVDCTFERQQKRVENSPKDHEEALKQKQGMVLNAADYFRQYNAGWTPLNQALETAWASRSTDQGKAYREQCRKLEEFHAAIAKEFPIGCTLRVSGVAKSTFDQSKQRPDLKDVPYGVLLLLDKNEAWCYTTDKTLFLKWKKGEKATLQGVLAIAPALPAPHMRDKRRRGSPIPPLQITMKACVEAKD